jgi:arylsulfatase A-like enzyme
MRRTIPVWLAMGLALPSLGAQGAAPAKPNIVFITSDDQRWDALGAAGNPAIHTPELDRLAAQGIYFRQATTHVSFCMPVRATLLTGLTPHQHGVYQRPEAMRPDAFQNLPTVPGLLREAGYRTLMIGKWHLIAEPWRSGFSDVRTWLPSGIAEYRNPLLAHGNSREMVETKGFTQQIFADEAIRFVRSPAAKEKPFFLWLAFTAPHVPLEPNPAKSARLYGGKTTSELLPPGFPRDIPTHDWRHYYEAVSELDLQVGRVVAALKKAGLAESTALVILGDNGFMMGQRGVGVTGAEGKIVPYEGSIRVPLIVWTPGMEGLAGPSDLPASSLDVPVTLVTLAGIHPPATWAGRDLLAALRRDPKNGLEDAFTEWADDGERWGAYRLVRTVRHKLIVWKDPAKPNELYDLTADPAEEKNLYDKPEMQEVQKDLEARLRAWMERTQDPALQWPKVSGSVPSTQ